MISTINKKHYAWLLAQKSVGLFRSHHDEEITKCARSLVKGYSHLQYDLGLDEDATPEEVEAVMLPLMKDAVWAALSSHILDLTMTALEWKFEHCLNGDKFVDMAVEARREADRSATSTATV